MKISINVPSYKRADKLDTLKLLPNANYWVHEFEKEEYSKLGIDNLFIIPDKLKGNIAKVRNFILDSTDLGYDVIVQIDDDFKHIGYWEDKKAIRLTQEKEIIDMIEKYSGLADKWGVKLWGVNVNPDKQNYREYTPFYTLRYISASFSCFLKGNELRYDERFSLKEDYDMTLQQLNKYRQVLRINKYFYVKKSVEQIGGCSMYRNIDREKNQILLLQQKWGRDIVKFDINDRSHSTDKVSKIIDINPIIKSPIKGV